MQIFLPYKSFKKSAETLDFQRLGKQRVEALQIINIIEGNPRKDGLPYKGWINHPCIIMWRKYLSSKNKTLICTCVGGRVISSFINF